MFKGSFTALITPFDNGAVDEDAFCRAGGIADPVGTHGLVPVGTTGESPPFRMTSTTASSSSA